MQCISMCDIVGREVHITTEAIWIKGTANIYGTCNVHTMSTQKQLWSDIWAVCKEIVFDLYFKLCQLMIIISLVIEFCMLELSSI